MARRSEGKTAWNLITTLACSLRLYSWDSLKKKTTTFFFFPEFSVSSWSDALNYLGKGYMFIYKEPAMNVSSKSGFQQSTFQVSSKQERLKLSKGMSELCTVVEASASSTTWPTPCANLMEAWCVCVPWAMLCAGILSYREMVLIILQGKINFHTTNQRFPQIHAMCLVNMQRSAKDGHSHVGTLSRLPAPMIL